MLKSVICDIEENKHIFIFPRLDDIMTEFIKYLQLTAKSCWQSKVLSVRTLNSLSRYSMNQPVMP